MKILLGCLMKVEINQQKQTLMHIIFKLLKKSG